jgi:hypothetical protein
MNALHTKFVISDYKVMFDLLTSVLSRFYDYKLKPNMVKYPASSAALNFFWFLISDFCWEVIYNIEYFVALSLFCPDTNSTTNFFVSVRGIAHGLESESIKFTMEQGQFIANKLFVTVCQLHIGPQWCYPVSHF